MLRASVLEELAISERVVRSGHEVVPRYLVIAQDGEHTMMVQLPDDIAARNERMSVLRAFMIWKAATGFAQSTELIEPDAIASFAVTRQGVSGARRISRSRSVSLSPIEWFGVESVGEDILALLPPREVTLTHDDVVFIDKAFAHGTVPGIR